MSGHVPDPVLRAFALGEIAEEEAVGVALHLDACARCAARAEAADPLAQAFASAPSPAIPNELVRAAVAAAARPEGARAELAIGAAMLAAAAVLAASIADPAAVAARVAVLGRAWLTVGAQLGYAIGPLALGAAVCCVAAAVLTVAATRLLDPEEGAP